MNITRRATVGMIATALSLPVDAYAGFGIITNFTIANSSAGTSKCRYRRALWFAKGHIPKGSIPVIRQGNTIILAQFDERKSWSDGCLQLCVMSMMDNDFAGLESRTYTVSSTPGSYNNAGPRSLADVTSTHAFKVAFSNVTQFDGSTTLLRGSGAFTAEFNKMAAATTRVLKYHSGPVCSSWEVWGMAADNAGGADPHLKTVWYVTAWNNPNGTLNDVEYGAVVAQDWWNVGGKFRLNYDAALMDGATAVQGYAGIQHPYHAQWMTVRTANDNNHARRFWAAAIPTLYHTFDKNYARSTGLFPYLDPNYVPASNAAIGYISNYTPLSAQNHRAGIDQTGGYMGRGLMPNTDCVAWMRQTPADYRYARTNACAGLHVPYHYRSNATRRIASGPQAGTDTANTVISLIMRPLSPGQYDFTASGMPAPIDAYVGSCSASVASTFVAKTGGDGVWKTSPDASHAVAYSFGMYLLEGERHFMQATLDLATNACHQLNGNEYGGAPQANYYGVAPFEQLLNIPSTQYSGMANARPEGGNLRNAGWGMMLVAQAGVVCPDTDVQSGFIKLFRQQQGAFTVFNMSYMEPTQLALGIYTSLSGGLNSPWESNFQVMAYAFNAIANEDKNSQAAIDKCLQYSAIAPWKNGVTGYRSNDYRELVLLKSQAPYDRVTNAFLSLSAIQQQVDVTVASNIITSNSETRLSPTNGDVLFFSRTSGSNDVVAIPAGFVEAKPYYAVNCSGQTMQVSATRSGPPLAIANGTYSIGCQPAQWDHAVPSSAIYMPAADGYPSISAAALVMASKAGANAITPAMIAAAQGFVAPIDTSMWVTWRITA